MIILMQILQAIKGKENRELLIGLISDISFEVEEMGYEGLEEELIEGFLFDHFGLELLCPKQLTMLTDYILSKQEDPTSLKSLLHVVNMQLEVA